MTLVTVKTKYQVTLPASIRKQAGLAVGDILEAKVVGKEITLSPKSVIDRDLALALEDVRKGRTHGPFNSAEAARSPTIRTCLAPPGKRVRRTRSIRVKTACPGWATRTQRRDRFDLMLGERHEL